MATRAQRLQATVRCPMQDDGRRRDRRSLIAFVAVGLAGWAPAAPHPKLEAGDACHCVSGRGRGRAVSARPDESESIETSLKQARGGEIAFTSLRPKAAHASPRDQAR